MSEEEAWDLSEALDKVVQAISLTSNALDAVSEIFAEMDSPTQNERALAALLDLSGRHLLGLTTQYEDVLIKFRNATREKAYECLSHRQAESPSQSQGETDNAA